MKDIREIVREQKTEKPVNNIVFKCFAVLVILILIYISYKFVKQDFKYLTFLNVIFEKVLHLLYIVINFLSGLIRKLIMYLA